MGGDDGGSGADILTGGAGSDQNGNFVMERLPAGQYRAAIWHEKLDAKMIGLR